MTNLEAKFVAAKDMKQANAVIKTFLNGILGVSLYIYMN